MTKIGQDEKTGKFTQDALRRQTQQVLAGKKKIKVVHPDVPVAEPSASVQVFADHAEPCMQPIGLTTCGYPRAHLIHNNKSSMSYHQFRASVPTGGEDAEVHQGKLVGHATSAHGVDASSGGSVDAINGSVDRPLSQPPYEDENGKTWLHNPATNEWDIPASIPHTTVAQPAMSAEPIKPTGSFLIDHPKLQSWSDQGYAIQAQNGLWLHYAAICTLLKDYASQQCASLRDEIERLHVALCQAASLMNQGEHFDAYKIVREALAASPKGEVNG